MKLVFHWKFNTRPVAQEYSAKYEIRLFITVFTRASYWFLAWST